MEPMLPKNNSTTADRFPMWPALPSSECKLTPEPDGSPLFTLLPLVACWRYEPREHLRPLALSRPALPPSPLRDRVSYSDHDRFRGYFPVHFIPAYNLPVYASQRPLPDATQDSARGCSLGFAAAVIADGRLQHACKAKPAPIRSCAANALGSYLEYLTWNRWFGHGCSTRGDGRNRLISRTMRSHVSRCRWLRGRR